MPDTAHRQADIELSHRRGVGRILRVPLRTGTPAGVVSIAALLGACLAVSGLVGGADRLTPYWYFLPIVFAAVRFGAVGAGITAVAAAVFAGSLTNLVVGPDPPQAVGEQVAPAVAFVLVGVGVALVIERTVELTRARLSSEELGERVAAAIARGDVGVEYQPIWALDAGSERMVGAEALVRWVDPEDGAVPPGTFVPVLEATDRLDRLASWVLEQACRDLAAWRSSGHDTDPPFHLAVNVSGTQLDDDLPDRIAALLDRHGVDGAGLVLELTERTVLADRARARPVLARIRELGVRIAVDDFGTGYSSLAYLRDLDFDILKLDRAFIDGLGSTRPEGDDRDAAIVGAVIALAQRLGKQVIVEGVESRAQLERIAPMGPIQVQGALLSPPIDAAALSERLRGGERPPADERAGPPPARAPRGSRISTWLREELTLVATGRESAHNRPAEVVLAGMFLAGALLTIAVVAFSDGRAEGPKLALGVVALPLALFLYRARRAVPEWALHLLLLAGTGLVLGAVASDPVPTTMVATSAYLIWVTVYAAAFFSLRDAVVHGVIAGGGFGLVLHLSPVAQDAAVWLTIMGTAGVAGFVVGWFARQLRSIAATDTLTGLPNRQAFESLLGPEIDRAQRTNAPLAVALVDLDDFKTINDSRGHQAGDRVLAELPGQWRTELRAHDVLARFGGDEFVVLLPNCPLDDAEDVLTRMSRAGTPSCSVGVVALAWGEDPATLLARADRALYRAKTQRAVVRTDRSLPIEHAVGGSAEAVHPARSARLGQPAGSLRR